jgi:hypothetical protein
MKPTIENLRKVAEELSHPHELSMLKDDIAFYIAGVKEAARALGRSVNDVEPLLDKARRAEEYIIDKIALLLASGRSER